MAGNILVQRKTVASQRQVPRVKRDGEIRTTAYLVGGIYRCIEAMVKMGAHRRNHVAAGRKAKHSDFVRIDMPLSCTKAHQPNRSLRILQGCR